MTDGQTMTYSEREREFMFAKKEKESSWVKLKGFPTNIGRPNKSRSQTVCMTMHFTCRQTLKQF